jgi:hypothetical protein
MRALLTLPFLLAAAMVACGLTAPASARADDDRPKVLFVPHGSVPYPLREAIPRALGARAELLSTNSYLARCRRHNVRYYSDRAITRIATRMGADVIAIASWASWGRSRVIRMIYRDGETGRVLHSTRHTLPGVRLDAAARRGLAREALVTGNRAGETEPDERVARASRAAPERAREPEREPEEPEPDERGAAEESDDDDGEGGLPPPIDWNGEEDAGSASAAATEGDAPEEDDAAEEAAQAAAGEGGEAPAAHAAAAGFGFEVTAGFGFGARAAAVPMEAGPARLSTSPFPAAALGLVAGYDAGTVELQARVRYTTSVGLRTKDIRSDGTTRTVDARSQSLHIGVGVELPLNDSTHPTLLDLEVGYQFRLFHAEVPISMPEYTLSGIYVRADLSFAIGSGPLRLAIAPEVGSVNGVTEQLQDAGQVDAGVAVGGEAAVRVHLFDELELEVVYRESHAFLSSERDSDMTDVERFGLLRATYTP